MRAWIDDVLDTVSFMLALTLAMVAIVQHAGVFAITGADLGVRGRR